MGIYRTRPVVNLNDNPKDAIPQRTSWYSEPYVQFSLDRRSLADEGSYFTIKNATLNTALAGHVAPSLANNDPTPTKALLHIYNGSPRPLMVDYLWMRLAVVNASSTATNFLGYVDSLGASGRTSGGTAITPTCTRGDAPFATLATVYFGAVVVASPSAVKAFQQVVRPVIAVVEDQYTFRFGAEPGLTASVPVNGTAVACIAVNVPAITVPPFGNFYLCEANPSGAATAATYEFMGAYAER